ncbi:conserved hypothetical protein [Burkholderia gladioli]|uniref:hypothetical protein n=1 Tax=Burkholderia gladioli TaxID=28095 RepID=UPI001CB50B2C|nr:hypothetical protein [Burkholderia gladioli]CAG9208529.1 conserved hypothetical protein [Burkholderia gladioli]
MDTHVSFPAYVPEDVRHYVTRQLDQFSRLYHASQQKLGELREHAHADDEANQIDVRNEARCSEYWVQAAARVRRIVLDPRLHDVFDLLSVDIGDEKGGGGFFHAALDTDNDYNEFRDAHREAATVAQRIAVAADDLARLLQQFERIGIEGPPEFSSVRELLRVAESFGADAGRRDKWLVDRDWLLGGRGVDADVDETRKRWWKSAPYPRSLLQVMASAARRFEPYEDGPAGAALDSRQRNRKWEYLRAFIYELLNDGFRVSDQKITAAVAVMAAVVLDDDVSDDDVRKATKRVADYIIDEWGGSLPG